jgi:hypothetical protein
MANNLDFSVQFDTQSAADDFKRLFEAYIAGSKRAGDAANAALGGTVTKKVELRLESKDGAKTLATTVKEARTELDKYERAFKNATRTQPGSVTSVRQQLNQARSARDQIAKFNQEIDKTNRSVVFSAKLSPEWLSAESRVKSLQQELRNLEAAGGTALDKIGASFNLGGIAALGRGVSDIVNIFQSLNIIATQLVAPIKAVTGALAELQSFGLSFQAIGQGASGATKALSDAQSIALGLGVSIQTVREGFKQLSPVIINSGGNLGDVSSIVESLSSRFAAFGLNADKSRRVLNGVIQAFAKGKLQAEELTQQISEADPAFKTDFANALFASAEALKATGGKTAELGKELETLAQKGEQPISSLEGLVKQGKITTDVLIKILPQLSKASLLFGKLGPTANTAVDALQNGSAIISQVEANIANLNQLNLEKFAKFAEPLVATFLRAQAVITDFVTRILEIRATKDIISIFNSVGEAVLRVLNALTALVEGFLQLASAVTPLISALASIPGVLELIGLSIIGRFLNPLSNLKGSLADNLVVQNKFIQGLKKAWKDASPGVDDYRGKIEKLSQRLTTPLATNSIIDTAKPDNNIINTRVKQEENANKRIQADTSKTLDNVTARYRQYVSEVSALQKKKSDDPTKILRQQLTEQTGLLQDARKEYANLPKVAQQAAGGEVFTPIDVNAVKNIDNTSDALKRLINQYNDLTDDLANRPGLVNATNFGGNQFLRDIRSIETELKAFAGSNPDEAFKILSLGAKIAATDVSSASQLLQGSVAKTGKVIDDLISGLPAQAIVSGQDIVDDASVAKAGQLQQKIKGLESEIAKTQASLAAPVSSFTEKEEKRLTKLQGRLRETQLEYRALQGAGGAPAAAADDTSLSARLDQVRKQGAAEQQLSKQTKDRLLAEKIANNSGIADADKKIVLKEKEIEATRRLIQAQSSFRLAPAQSGQIDSTAVLRKQQQELADLNSERSLAVQALTSQAAAESDLVSAQSRATRVGATLNDQLNFAKVALNNAETNFANLTTQVNNAEKALKSASSRLASLTDIGATSRRSSAQLREIIDLRQQIPQLESDLADLRQRQGAAGGTVTDLSSAYRTLSGDIKTTNGLFPSFNKGLGLIKSGASGIGVALRNAFSGAALGAKALLSSIGPLEIILIGTAIATRAYNDANAVTAQVTSESANRIKVLDTALKELKGTTQSGEKPISGFALAWLRLSYIVKDVADTLGSIFAPALDTAATGIGVFISNALKLGTALAAGAIAGAALGATILGIGAIPGAVIGATVAGIIAIAGAGSDADVKLRELNNRIKALGNSAKAETTKTKTLIEELKNLQVARDADRKKGVAPNAATDAKIAKNFVIARDSVQALRDQIKGLETDQKGVNDAMKGMPAEIRKAIAVQNELAAAGKKSAELQAKATAQGARGDTIGQRATIQEIVLLDKRIKELNKLKLQLPTPTQAQVAKYNDLNNTAYALKVGIQNLNGVLAPTEAQLKAFAKATGRIYDPAKQATSSIGQLKDIIEGLEDSAKTYDLTSKLGRTNYDQDINKVNRLKSILEFISKTKWEIKLETTKIQNQLNQAQLDINLNPGSFRESQKLASEIGADINTASQTFLNKVQAARDLAAENPKFSAQAAEYIKQAAQEYLVSTREGAAKIIEAGRKFKEELDAARSGLQDLKLGKPEFFAPEEIRQNAIQIEQDFTAALAKVREQFPDFTPKLDTSSADALLKSKKDFVDTRKEADKLADTMKQAADAMTIAAAALAKLAGIELKDLKVGGDSFAKLFSEGDKKKLDDGKKSFQDYVANVLNSEKQLGELGGSTAQGVKRIGEVIGKISTAASTYSNGAGKKISVPAKEAVLYYDNLTGKVEEVTGAEFKRLQAADKASAATTKGAQQSSAALGNITPTSNGAASSVTNIGNAASQAGGNITAKMVKGVAVISNIGTAGEKSASKLSNAFSGAIKPLSSYIKGLDGASSAENQRQAFIDKLQQTGQNFAAGAGAQIVFGTKVQPPNQQLIQEAARKANGDFNTAIAGLETQGFTMGDPMGGPAAQMNSWASSAANYAVALETVNIAQAQLNTATAQYEQAKAAGFSTDELEIYRAGIQSAKDALAGANEGFGGLQTAKQAFSSAADEAKRLGINIQSIPNVKPGSSDFGVGGPTVAKDMNQVSVDTGTAAGNMENLANSAETAAQAGQRFADVINNIPNNINLNGTITISNTQGRWAGGPVSAGTTYRVNELGQEGFLSNAGTLSDINRPKNSLWRPPATGTVIPAHIMDKLKSAGGSVKASRTSANGYIARAGGMNSTTSMLMAYFKAQSIASSRNEQDSRRVQSHQAAQIGKLAEAVNNLVDKNWNVDVKVRNTGNAAYLDAFNRLL